MAYVLTNLGTKVMIILRSKVSMSLGLEYICLNETKLTLTDQGKYQQC